MIRVARTRLGESLLRVWFRAPGDVSSVSKLVATCSEICQQTNL